MIYIASLPPQAHEDMEFLSYVRVRATAIGPLLRGFCTFHAHRVNCLPNKIVTKMQVIDESPRISLNHLEEHYAH